MNEVRWSDRLWIIDGHNAIFALPDLQRLQTTNQRQAARQALEALLQPFARSLTRPLVVVYDGNRMPRNPEAGEQQGVLAVFSQPPDEEADDRIVFLADQAIRRGEAVTVVTNDRRSLAAALPRVARVLSVDAFRERHLPALPAAPEPDEKHLGAEERQEIERAFLDRAEEIMARARRGACRRERELAARWRARTGAAGAVGPRGAGADGLYHEEPPHRWSWLVASPSRGPARAEPASTPGAGGDPAPRPSSNGPGEKATRGTDPSARPGRPDREARRKRGLRKQQRRLEHQKRRRRKSK